MTLVISEQYDMTIVISPQYDMTLVISQQYDVTFVISQQSIHTVSSSSICSTKLSSFGRRIHEIHKPCTNLSDNMGGSGCWGIVPLVRKQTVSLVILERKERSNIEKSIRGSPQN